MKNVMRLRDNVKENSLETTAVLRESGFAYIKLRNHAAADAE